MTSARVPTSAALAARDVTKRYGAVDALLGVSLDVDAGECVALVGESGSGKTTLLRCFNRTVDPDAGDVSLDGTSLRSMDPIALRRATGYVPQNGGLLPHWTVKRNAATVPVLTGRSDADRLAGEALDRVGLDPRVFGSRWPRELSGGQRQRVAIARALAVHPRVVLMDEPFGALDAITRSEMQQWFRGLRARLRFTALLVTHDLREAFLLGDRVAVVRSGRLEQVGRPSELQDAPATAYVEELLDRAGVA